MKAILPETNSGSRLKLRRGAPKGNSWTPTIDFQGHLLFVSGRVSVMSCHVFTDYHQKVMKLTAFFSSPAEAKQQSKSWTQGGKKDEAQTCREGWGIGWKGESRGLWEWVLWRNGRRGGVWVWCVRSLGWKKTKWIIHGCDWNRPETGCPKWGIQGWPLTIDHTWMWLLRLFQVKP